MGGSNIPIYSHTDVLGVDIGVWQRDSEGIDINVYPDHSFWDPRVYRELCDWIRRNRIHV